MASSSAKRFKKVADGLTDDQVLDIYERDIENLVEETHGGMIAINYMRLQELQNKCMNFAAKLNFAPEEKIKEIMAKLVSNYFKVITKQCERKVENGPVPVSEFVQLFGFFLYRTLVVLVGTDASNAFHVFFDLFALRGQNNSDEFRNVIGILKEYARERHLLIGDKLSYVYVTPIQMEWRNYRVPGDEATLKFRHLLPGITENGTVSNAVRVEEAIKDVTEFRKRFVYRSDAEALDAFVKVMPMFRMEFEMLTWLKLDQRVGAQRILSLAVNMCVSAIKNTGVDYGEWLFYIVFGTDELKERFKKKAKRQSALANASPDKPLSFNLEYVQGDIPDKYKYGEPGVTLTPENVTGLFILRSLEQGKYVYTNDRVIKRLLQYVQETKFNSMSPGDAFAVASALIMECTKFTDAVLQKDVIGVKVAVSWKSDVCDVVYLFLEKVLKQPKEEWLPLVAELILYGLDEYSITVKDARLVLEHLFLKNKYTSDPAFTRKLVLNPTNKDRSTLISRPKWGDVQGYSYYDVLGSSYYRDEDADRDIDEIVDTLRAGHAHFRYHSDKGALFVFSILCQGWIFELVESVPTLAGNNADKKRALIKRIVRAVNTIMLSLAKTSRDGSIERDYGEMLWPLAYYMICSGSAVVRDKLIEKVTLLLKDFTAGGSAYSAVSLEGKTHAICKCFCGLELE